MVAIATIARYEALRQIQKRLGVTSALADDEANQIDAELVELTKRLPDGCEWPGT